MAYHIGQVCLNGHELTGNTSYGFGAPYCDRCGAASTTKCAGCGASIRGYAVDGFGATFLAPAHCFSCGRPFPWTEAKLAAVRELADAIDELTTHEREVIVELLPHLIQETPRTQPAGFKVAAILGQLTGPGKAALRKIIEEVAVEAGKKAIGL